MKSVFFLLAATVVVACASHNKTSVAANATSPETTSTSAAASKTEESFGGTITLDRASAVSVGDAMSHAELYGTSILITGVVVDVCQKKGCWMTLVDGDQQMRVTFKDYAFFVPKNCSGRRVLVEGVVTQEEISEEDARHYASESTTEGNPEDIHGSQSVVSMEATAVVFQPGN